MNHIILKNPSLCLVLPLKKIIWPFQLWEELGSAPQKPELQSHEIRVTDRVYETDPLMEFLQSWYFQKQDSNRIIYVPGLAKKEAICITSFTWLFAKGLSYLNTDIINYCSISVYQEFSRISWVFWSLILYCLCKDCCLFPLWKSYLKSHSLQIHSTNATLYSTPIYQLDTLFFKAFFFLAV